MYIKLANQGQSYVRSEAFTAVTMKKAVFWDVTPCRYFVNRRFGGTYSLHLQGIRNPRAMNQRGQIAVVFSAIIFCNITNVICVTTLLNPEDLANEINSGRLKLCDEIS
jgi:hypothetical protein